MNKRTLTLHFNVSLVQCRCPWNEDTCKCAAQEGHLDVLKWARSTEPPCAWDEETCAMAAMNGRLEILKWARENG